MISLLPSLAAALFLATPPTSLASQTPSTDADAARFKSALSATGLSVATSTSGLSHTIVFDHPTSRKQTVYIGVKPGKVGAISAYVLYTTVWVSKTPPDEALMRKTLGMTKKLGAFYLFKDSKDNWAIRFGTHFDATDLTEESKSGDAQVTRLKDMIYFVNQVGEETDKDLNGDNDVR
jgi:hypothetical protein